MHYNIATNLSFFSIKAEDPYAYVLSLTVDHLLPMSLVPLQIPQCLTHNRYSLSMCGLDAYMKAHIHLSPSPPGKKEWGQRPLEIPVEEVLLARATGEPLMGDLH